MNSPWHRHGRVYLGSLKPEMVQSGIYEIHVYGCDRCDFVHHINRNEISQRVEQERSDLEARSEREKAYVDGPSSEVSYPWHRR